MATLRTLLAKKVPRPKGTPRKPREGTKQQAELAMLRRAEGVMVAQIAETTGWATHTARGFLAGLKGASNNSLPRRAVGAIQCPGMF